MTKKSNFFLIPCEVAVVIKGCTKEVDFFHLIESCHLNRAFVAACCFCLSANTSKEDSSKRSRVLHIVPTQRKAMKCCTPFQLQLHSYKDAGGVIMSYYLRTEEGGRNARRSLVGNGLIWLYWKKFVSFHLCMYQRMFRNFLPFHECQRRVDHSASINVRIHLAPSGYQKNSQISFQKCQRRAIDGAAHNI